MTDPKQSPYDLAIHNVDYSPAQPFSLNLVYNAPKGNQVQRMQTLNDHFIRACNMIETLCPSSRDRSLALTHIQEARMFANASIILHEAGE